MISYIKHHFGRFLAIAVVLVGLVTLFRFATNNESRVIETPPSSAVSVEKQLVDVFESLDNADRNIQHALGSVGEWQRQMERIEDLAAIIAADSEMARRLEWVQQGNRISVDQIEAAQKSLVKVRVMVKQRMGEAQVSSLSSPEEVELRRLVRTASNAKEQWALAAKRLRAIVDQTSGSEPKSPAGDELAAPVSNAGDNVILAGIDSDISAEKSKEELRHQASSAEVLRVLAPFIEARYVQPSMSGGSVRFRKTFDKQPTSLSALQNAGALDPTIGGLKTLALIGGSRKLAEPKWAVHSQPVNWNDADEEMLKKAQSYLNEYGAVLVDAGTLSK